MIRKVLSISLCLCLVLGAMPFAAKAGVPLDHDCFSQDGNIWCDLCDEAMEHDCISTDGNIRCDVCDTLIPHVCRDQNRDGACDLCTRPCESAEFLPGDISGEGNVNMADVAKLYAHIKGSNVLADEQVVDRCDVTGEGRVNMADVAKLYAHIKGTNKLF